MTKTVLVFSVLSLMLLFAPTVALGQTEVGVEAETEAEVGVQVGSESESSSGESSAKAEGEIKSETKGETKAKSESKSETQEKPESKSQSSSSESKAQVSVGNMEVTTRGDAKATIGLPSKYPMPAVSASNSFALQTNQHLYKPGDTVMIEGSLWTDLLASLTGDETVTVQVFDRTRNVIYETNAEITTDGTFLTEFALPSDAAKGAYTISSSIQTDTDLSGLVGVKGKANLGASTKITVVPPQVFKVEVENHGEFDVKVATNSTVNSVKFNGEQKKVSVTVEGQSGTKGVSHISIPKDMVSGEMQVMIDGQIVANDQVVVTKHTEAETEVEVNYQHSIHTIEIIGTQAVPEFGTIAGLILAVAIISIIAVSARSKLNIMPRI